MDYALLERISVGGMAEVYRARSFSSPDAPGFYAIKRILPNLAEDDDFITMFVDEARLAIELNHPNICQMYELGQIHGSYYIAMEFIAGRDLLAIQKHLRSQRRVMAPAQAAFIIQQVCEGLDYAHRKTNSAGEQLKIVHRDISPQNVLVSYDGVVKVIDFGIARAATKTQTTQVGVLKGKFGYMSPEQVDSKDLDQRSDVFAVGTLFWELLTARRLFHAENDYEILERVRAARVAPPSSRNPAVPPELDRIVLKALTRDRDDRYSWASEMAADLRAWLATVRPPYTEATLSSWMLGAFREMKESEAHKKVEFARFRTPEDVRAYNRELSLSGAFKDSEVVDLQDLTTAPEESTRIFDPEAGAAAEVFAEAQADHPAGSTGASGGGSYGSNSSAGSVPLPASLTGAYGPKRRGPWLLILSLLTAALIGLGAFVLAPLFLATGSVIVTTDPVDGTTVSLSGIPLEGPQPMVSERLRPGSYILEIKHPDYEPLLEEITVEQGDPVRFDRSLTPLGGLEVPLELEVSPAEATIYVNGVPEPGEGSSRVVTLRTAEEMIVEVAHPGYLSELMMFNLNSREPVSRAVELREATGTVTVRSQPSGAVFVNGEERGVSASPLQISGLALHRPHELEIRAPSASYRDFSQVVVFDTSPAVQIFPRLRRISEPADSGGDSAYGTLIMPNVDGRWRVLVDDRDLGVVTPISAEDPLALRSGERTLTFQRGLEERKVEINIVAGEELELELPAR